MDWSQAVNMPVSSAENHFINGDLYEKMMIFKIKVQNAGFVNIGHRLGTCQLVQQRTNPSTETYTKKC